MAEPTKTCPSCGAEILGAARVCKLCRHRFANAGDQAAGEPQPGTLTAPGPAARRTTAPMAWIGAAVLTIAVIVVIAVASSGSSTSTSTSTSTSIITGSQVETQLTGQLQSRSADPVSNVACPDQELPNGDTIHCTVSFESGRSQAVVVTVTGTSSKPHLSVSLGQ